MLSDGLGGFIHLNRAVEGWLQAGRNPFGLYLYREDVDGAARAFVGEALSQPRDTPWGMYEFALNGPDETLVASAGRPDCAARREAERQPSRSGNVGVAWPDKTAPMTREDYDAFCGSLPHATHVVQWGDASVWKIGGKVFAIGGWFDGPRICRDVQMLEDELRDPERIAGPAAGAVSRLSRTSVDAAHRHALVQRP